MRDQDFLLLALKEAQNYTHVTTAVKVGAVITINDHVCATGFHQGPGTDHAEVMAIKNANCKLDHATLYVTLEPCNHYGKTPPCTKAILDAGIKKVVYAYKDFNPDVKGSGAEYLKANGVEVVHKPLDEINDFYLPYDYGYKHQMPMLELKQARFAESHIIGLPDKRLMITDDKVEAWTMSKRIKADALMTSTQTILIDNPLFTIRQGNETLKTPPLVICGQTQIPGHYRIHKQDRDIIYIQKDLESNLSKLYQKGYRRIWVECGHKFGHNLHQKKLLRNIYIVESKETHQSLKSVIKSIDVTSMRPESIETVGLCEVIRYKISD
ncbi:MAG: bifunctional diaminohydroxyphosphoribosylaminopyrimidine deaminase/5-amino-6-(5-phosphoribosylamino)uracil reductase RibD [Gammaproteobacteria bacterium]|nr:bifunctional diaminohydroxyphosphoribosylaminopyrimidine deaminase/5-amino-6-(5-phosphoribosylamino)uracil reductase RibD [Gammaproteobacteria bacterium]